MLFKKLICGMHSTNVTVENFSLDYVKNFQKFLHGCSGAIVH